MSKPRNPGANVAARIREMKVGESFHVETDGDRLAVCKAAKVLKDSGAIAFTVFTRRNREGEGYTVYAVE